MKSAARKELLEVLRRRFEANPGRHQEVPWSLVEPKLTANANALQVLHEMERTGGEPDVIAWDRKAGTVTFCDCSPESPKGRRSLCYDRAALDARKEHKPGGNVVETAAAIGIELLTEAQYRQLQQLGEFDLKTSSWIVTPPAIRKLGGALFGDRRYDQVFVYHNGAESYYAARGFRGAFIC